MQILMQFFSDLFIRRNNELFGFYLCHSHIQCVYIYLIQNSQAVKKVCGPQKGYGEKRCEIQGGGQEMAVMVG